MTHTPNIYAFIGVVTLGVYFYKDQQTARVCACLHKCVYLQSLAFTYTC